MKITQKSLFYFIKIKNSRWWHCVKTWNKTNYSKSICYFYGNWTYKYRILNNLNHKFDIGGYVDAECKKNLSKKIKFIFYKTCGHLILNLIIYISIAENINVNFKCNDLKHSNGLLIQNWKRVRFVRSVCCF
jgi:hypothetical protein